jgi:hypothetical protein
MYSTSDVSIKMLCSEVLEVSVKQNLNGYLFNDLSHKVMNHVAN